jgi:hypothetical protein
LTKEEVIDFYNVPVIKKPVYKFVWELTNKRYVQLVREESTDDGRTGPRFRGVLMLNLLPVLMYL